MVTEVPNPTPPELRPRRTSIPEPALPRVAGFLIPPPFEEQSHGP